MTVSLPPRSGATVSMQNSSSYVFEAARKVGRLLQNLQKPGDPARVSAALELLGTYDALVAQVYKTRASALHSPNPAASEASAAELAAIEDAASEISQSLIPYSRVKKSEGIYVAWRRRYVAIWRSEVDLLIFVTAVFLCSCLIGWNVGVNLPSYVPVIIPQPLLEDVLEHRSWFESITDAPLIHGLSIAWNNIQVAINCFVGGAVLGLGGFLILCFNGVSVGAIMGYCFANGFDEQLSHFIFSHGPLELSVFVAATCASLVFGRTFYMRPYKLFGRRLAENGRRAGILALGVTPWLLLAAGFESLVSPFDYLGPGLKMVVGLLIGILFWMWNFGLTGVILEGKAAR